MAQDIERVGVVTGGGALGDDDGYGIGNAVARLLGRSGVAIAVVDLSEERAGITVDQVRKQGGDAQAFVADVTDGASVSRAVDSIAQHFGRIDLLVNVVGKSAPRSEFGAQDPGVWDDVIAVNLRSVLNCTHACLPHILKQPSGRIVSVSSDAAKHGEAGQAVYSACKAGIVAFSKAIAREVGPRGVTVNVVSPGVTNNAAVRERLARPEFTEVVKGWRASIPMGRFAEPEDIAAAVAFLVSPQAGHVTGQTLSVNGGSLMSG